MVPILSAYNAFLISYWGSLTPTSSWLLSFLRRQSDGFLFTFFLCLAKYCYIWRKYSIIYWATLIKVLALHPVSFQCKQQMLCQFLQPYCDPFPTPMLSEFQLILFHNKSLLYPTKALGHHFYHESHKEVCLQ